VYPEGALPNEAVWLRRIAEAVDERPVLVTNRFHAFDDSEYYWVPFHGAWLVRREPLTEQPGTIAPRPATFGDELRLLGYRLATDSVSPGGMVELEVCWQVVRTPAHDYTAFAQLVGPEGVVGQGDLPHATTRYRPGEVRVDAYRFPLLLHAPAGEYRLITGFYYAVDGGWQRLEVGGADHVALAPVTVLPAEETPATLHPTDRAFAGGLRLVGVDYDAGVPGQGRLYLHWEQAAAAPALGPWRPTSEAATVQAVRDGETVASAPLPALPPGGGATVAMDLPFADGGPLRIVLIGADGAPLPALGAWHLPRRGGLPLRAPKEGERYVPLGGEMAFVGLSGTPAAAQAGQELWLRPRFLALRALTVDDSVSVGLARPDLGWEQKTDGTPALGAIPTLKWVRGWQVEDPHPLLLAPDAPAGTATVTVAVYDAFTLAPLHVLDERLVRDGQGIQFRAGSVEIGP